MGPARRIGSALPHHADRGLLGAVLDEPLANVVETEAHVTDPRAPFALRDAESIQGLQHARPAGAQQARDLTGGLMLTPVELFEKVFAKQRRQRYGHSIGRRAELAAG
jgi:hypothetical protein